MAAEIPFQLGITGGIGSGKSVFARIFGSMGVPVYESDAEARRLYLEAGIRARVQALLGEAAYLADGRPDTGFIAAKIYAEPSLRIKLNEILHPAVSQHYHNWLRQQKQPYVLKVAALLFEADIARHLDFTVLVVSPETLRKNRISRRDPQRSTLQTEAIIASQWPDDAKMKQADHIVYNDEQHSLIAQAMLLHQKVLNMIPQSA